MSVMAIEAPTFLPRGRSLTRADLAALPDDGHRYELVDGVLVVTPAPRIQHQEVAGNLYAVLRAATPGDLKLLFAPVDVVLADDTVIQPDLLVAPRTAFTEIDLPAPPLLAVEVLSPSTRGIDLLLKRERLQRAGCRHYWVVDPAVPSIVAWHLVDGAYEEMARASGVEQFVVAAPFAVSLTPVSLLG
ncbi:Uma2 family endonuclease [Salana multivorans]